MFGIGLVEIIILGGLLFLGVVVVAVLAVKSKK
jgi:formate/nitrite transporter FocA (FNT family)